MADQIPYLVKRLKQRHISLVKRNKISYQLGKLIEEGEHVPLSIKAKRGARRTYYLYKGNEELLNRSTTRPRELANMNEAKFQEFLMGHSEISQGNVLEISLDDVTAPPQYNTISHDLDVTNLTYDLETLRNSAKLHETVRTTSTLHDIFQDLPELDSINQNITELSGLPRNIPELLEI